MGPPAGDKKPEKTTLLGSMNPWASSGRSTPTPTSASTDSATTAAGSTAAITTSTTPKITTSGPVDHGTRSYYGRSFKRYPPGCPPLKVQWFHAVDIAKRKSHWMGSKQPPQDSKPPQAPKKYVNFSANDNRSIETAYQKELEGFEDRDEALPGLRARGKSTTDSGSSADIGEASGKDEKSSDELQTKGSGVKVPVNEDFLFDVDIENRELAPVYWLGPVYDVRRGTWFYQEGSNLRPCEENLAAQLEEGYLKAKPWLYPVREKQPAAGYKEVTVKKSADNLAAEADSKAKADATVPPSSVVASMTALFTSTTSSSATAGSGTQDKPKPKPSPTAPTFQPESHRLFGQYMSHIATYQDETTAWLSTDSVLSRVASTMYERFSGGGYMSGIKVVRGYSEPKKAKDDKEKAKEVPAKDEKRLGVDEAEEKRLKALKRRSAPPSTTAIASSVAAEGKDIWETEARISSEKVKNKDEDPKPVSELERRSTQLQRQLSSLMVTNETNDPEQEAEEIRRRAEKEISDDYNAQSGESQGREIEHLFLVTHGIGQLLGLRMESLNFIHDVNTLRKTLKSVYSESKDLRALNAELPEGPGNCRIQVLPVCWRHLLDFPRRRSKTNGQEQDLSEMNEEDEEEEYPALEDITIEGVAFARALISDLALDILLYQSAYREQIAEIVLSESNRIYNLFLERNPNFKGTVHVIGHSLGSAIMFDILCRQKEKKAEADSLEPYRNPLSIWPSTKTRKPKSATAFDDDEIEGASPVDGKKNLEFDFDVQDFYCLGSPIGLFQMLKGRTIAARHLLKSPQLTEPPSGTVSSLADGDSSPFGFEYTDDTFMTAPSTTAADQRVSSITGLPMSISSPKVGQLFNIFHPSDPISYRLEPLIAPAMKTLKPQPLPYTKKGILSSVAPQGLTDIGARVGQSFSGMWSSLQANLTTNIIKSSLGLTPDDVSRLGQQGTTGEGNNGANDIVVDQEVETLYSHFEKKRADMAKESAKDSKSDGNGDESREERAARWRREEAKAQRMRREEAKVRALNRNGRVDFKIQESVMDFNPINIVASHMTYWGDEDVSHFIMSQVFTGKNRMSAKAKKASS